MTTVKYSLKISECESYEAMSAQAAAYFVKQLEKNPRSVLGLATGSTPLGLYKELIELQHAGQLSFRDVTTFNLDEYVGLDREHPQSYTSYMYHHFFQFIDIHPGRCFIPNGAAPNIPEEIARYETFMQQVGGIDLQVLGLGTNGHIGFNEPGTPFTQQTHCVELTEATRQANARYFESLDDVPKEAITMGIATIMQAKKIVLLVTGKNKKAAFERFLYGGVDPEFPASILRLHPNVSVYYHL